MSVLYVAIRSTSRSFPFVSIALLGMLMLNSSAMVHAANANAANSRSISVLPEFNQDSGRVSSLSRYLDQHAAADRAADARWAVEAKAMMAWVETKVRKQAEMHWQQFIVKEMFFRWQKQFRQAQQSPGGRDRDNFRSATKASTQRASQPTALSPAAGALSVLARIQARDWIRVQQFAGREIGKTFRRLELSHAKAGEIIRGEFHGLADRISHSVVNRTRVLIARLAASPEPDELAFLEGVAKSGASKSDDYWQYYADCDRWQVEFEFEPTESLR